MKGGESMKKTMPWNETLAYWLVNIATLGAAWILKIVIKKAIIESR